MVVEALKCLCNVVFNSVAAQQVGAEVQLAQGLCSRLQTARAGRHEMGHEVGLFSLRLLFLLSALRPDVRGGLCRELHAVRLLTEVLERTLEVRWVGPYEAAPPDSLGQAIPAEDNERAMEALKALFNLTLSDTGDQVSYSCYPLRAAQPCRRRAAMLLFIALTLICRTLDANTWWWFMRLLWNNVEQPFPFLIPSSHPKVSVPFKPCWPHRIDLPGPSLL